MVEVSTIVSGWQQAYKSTHTHTWAYICVKYIEQVVIEHGSLCSICADILNGIGGKAGCIVFVYLRSAVITIAVIMTSDIATNTIMTVIEVSSVRKKGITCTLNIHIS